MNKEIILDSYFHDLPRPKHLATLVTSFPKFFRSRPDTPENLRAFTQQPPLSAQTSTCDETLSFYSALSRVTVDQSLLEDIKINPKTHSPFQTLEQSRDEASRWFCRDSQWRIQGPLHCSEMDSRFQSKKLGPKAQVKEAFDDDFYPLIYVLKRYARKKTEQNIPERPTRKRQISGKLFRFKKGRAPRRRTLAAIENYKGSDLEGFKRGRTKTVAAKPRLGGIFEEGFGDFGEGASVPLGRIRARTRV